MNSHAAAARYLFKDKKEVVDFVLDDFQNAPISDKLKALLHIAGKAQQNGKIVVAIREAAAEDRIRGSGSDELAANLQAGLQRFLPGRLVLSGFPVQIAQIRVGIRKRQLVFVRLRRFLGKRRQQRDRFQVVRRG